MAIKFVSFFLLFITLTNSTKIMLKDNGYSNIVVAIAEDITRPDDGGISIVTRLKELITEASTILYEATNKTVYFRDINILLPFTWNVKQVPMTTEYSFQLADIRLITTSNLDFGAVPYTMHSGKCGIAGHFFNFPVDYLLDPSDNITVKAKTFVQQWAQFRYGVFEEHGYPNDKLLPYFYRHPDGYDSVSSSNDTVIGGDLISSSGVSNCDVDESGIISNPDECRFVPNATGQTATTSLMSFHWLDTVVGFSNDKTHDKRPPHRQNRLCNSRSSSNVISRSPDLINTSAKPDQNPTPGFRLFQNKMLPVLYLAIDKSKPSSSNNAGTQGLNILKGGLRRLFSILNRYPDIYVAWSTFENLDSGVGIYLKEEVPPTRYADAAQIFEMQVDNFTFSSGVLSRDVSAAVRDAELRLRNHKNIGGSILYVITSTESVTKDTIMEPDLAEKFLQNNVKMMVGESGPGAQVLSRFSVLSQGGYYYRESWGTTAFFTQINEEIDNLIGSGLKTERRIITSKKDSISVSKPWGGSFSIDDSVGTNTTILLRSAREGSFTVTITSPSGEQLIMENDPISSNWNDKDSIVGITLLQLSNPAASGQWSYNVIYDDSLCVSCGKEPKIHLQIGSSIRNRTSSSLPKFTPWVSLTAGSDFVDLAQHPAVIQARFDSIGGRLGDLSVSAEVISNSVVLSSIQLTDTGTMDSDTSNDGIYSGIFYPNKDGTYAVTFHAVYRGTATQKNKLLVPNQNSYCCGSALPTVVLNNFESTISEAIIFTVRNSTLSSQVALPIVTDLQATTYGVDGGQVYVDLTWTVPVKTKSQHVRYSEDYNQLMDETDKAPEATVVYGSLETVESGTLISVSVSAPYSKGNNVYFVVETTLDDGMRARSHVVWTEPYPPENAFTPPMSTTITQDTSTTDGSDTTTVIILSSTTPSTTPPTGNKELSPAEIGYIVTGVVLFILIIIGAIVYYRKKQTDNRTVDTELRYIGGDEGLSGTSGGVATSSLDIPAQLAGEQNTNVQGESAYRNSAELGLGPVDSSTSSPSVETEESRRHMESQGDSPPVPELSCVDDTSPYSETGEQEINGTSQQEAPPTVESLPELEPSSEDITSLPSHPLEEQQ